MVFGDFDFQECPSKFDRATYQEGKWKKDEFNFGGRFHCKQESSILLYLTSYNGGVYEDIEEWLVDIPLNALAGSAPGTWLVPINLEGNYTLCFSRSEAIHAILVIANNIWNKSHRLPTIEVVRLDAIDGEKQSLRIYQFWFAKADASPPHITSVSITDLK